MKILIALAAMTTVALPVRGAPAPLNISCGAFTVPPQVSIYTSQTCNVTGGTAPYVWSISAGALPPGLVLSTSAAIAAVEGFPAQAGTNFNYTISVADHDGTTNSFDVAVPVVLPAVVLTITTYLNLPYAHVNTPYSATLQAAGGTPPYHWTSQSPPPWLGLSSDGTLSGTPTEADVYSFGATVQDTTGNSAAKTFYVTVTPPPPTFTCGPAPGVAPLPVEVGVGFTTYCVGNGAGGLQWSSSVLPPGVFLSSYLNTSNISGAPSFTGPYSFSVTATDTYNQTATQSFSGTVVQRPDLVFPTLPHAAVGTPYSYQLSSTGGLGAITWTLLAGVVPGVALNSTGLLSGTPTQAGSFQLRMRVTDSNQQSSIDYIVPLTVDAARQTITFLAISNMNLNSGPFPLTATASSGLSVSFVSNTPTVCTISGGTVVLVGTGLCSVTASQNGNNSYASAPPVTQSFTVTAPTKQQSIVFGAINGRTVGDPPFQISASATSGLPVSLSSNTPSICVISGNTVTMLAAGICTITAAQTGNDTYAAATPVTQTFIVAPQLTSQNITLETINGHTFGDPPFQIAATASSGLPVSIVSNTPGVCVVAQNTVSILAAGTCSLTANQSGNSTYSAASTSQTFIVAKANQTITFASLPSRFTTDAPFGLQASSSSGLPVVFALLSGPAVLNGSTLTLNSTPGTITIQASQSGSPNFNAASPVIRSFAVTSPLPAVSVVTNGASFKSVSLAPSSYAAIFGSNFASQAGDPSVGVTFVDAVGAQFAADIVYVGTTQLNILVPSGLAIGAANLTVKNQAGTSTAYPVTVSPISPGLFTLDAAGVLPAAQVLTIAADGSRTVQDVGTCGTPQNCVYLPISLSPGTSVYLLLYGTGIRGRSSLDGVSATVGGISSSILYAGAQGGFAGLDQVNILLPNELAGRGSVDLILTVDGSQANLVRLTVQ